MSWSGSSFSRTNGVYSGSGVWTSDKGAGIAILSTRHDTHDQDLADGINACLHKGGNNTATADLGMGGFKHTNVGTGTARTHYARLDQVQDSASQYGGTSGGTGTAATLTLSPAITAYATGMVVRCKCGVTNTGSMTLNVNAVNAVTVKKVSIPGGTLVNLDANDFVITGAYEFLYDGTNWILMNPAISDIQSWTPTLGAGGTMTYTTTTINYAKYWRQGKKLSFAVQFTGTTGGAAHTDLTMTLPINAAGTVGVAGGCMITDGADLAGTWKASLNTTILIRRYDAGNWTAGAGRAVFINGWYETP